MIIDSVLLFQELDMLEYRLAILNDYVDLFVICESPVTFQNEPKPLYFAENRSRFEQYLPKIKHVITPGFPSWKKRGKVSLRLEASMMEEFQRFEQCRACYESIGYRLDDLVFICDVDEIWNPQRLPWILEYRKRNSTAVVRLEGCWYVYDYEHIIYEQSAQVKPKTFDSIVAMPPDMLRKIGNLRSLGFHQLKQHIPMGICPDSCWHLTWFGDEEFVINKVTKGLGRDLFYLNTLPDEGLFNGSSDMPKEQIKEITLANYNKKSLPLTFATAKGEIVRHVPVEENNFLPPRLDLLSKLLKGDKNGN